MKKNFIKVVSIVLTMLMLEEDSGVNGINLAISLALICLGIFILNYQPKKRLELKNN